MIIKIENSNFASLQSFFTKPQFWGKFFFPQIWGKFFFWTNTFLTEVIWWKKKLKIFFSFKKNFSLKIEGKFFFPSKLREFFFSLKFEGKFFLERKKSLTDVLQEKFFFSLKIQFKKITSLKFQDSTTHFAYFDT